VIARVSVSPEAVGSLGETSTSASAVFGQHAALCEALDAHGHLVFASQDEGKLLARSIIHVGERHPEAGKLWTALVKRLVQSRRFDYLAPPNATGLDGTARLQDLRAGWTAQTDVAAFADSRAETMGVGSGEMRRVDPESGIDVARIGAVAFAGTLADLKTLRDGGVIGHGESRERLWTDVLQPLAQVTRRFTVLDRYLFSSLADAVAGGRAAEGFVAWLLRHIDAEARDGCEITLAGFRGGPGKAPVDGAAAAALVSQVLALTGGRLGKVDLLVVQPASYLPHDRHITSDVGVGITLPASFDVFSRETITKREGVEFVYRWSGAAVGKLRQSDQRFADDRSAERVTAYSR
jgi:hypothetical protein